MYGEMIMLFDNKHLCVSLLAICSNGTLQHATANSAVMLVYIAFMPTHIIILKTNCAHCRNGKVSHHNTTMYTSRPIVKSFTIGTLLTELGIMEL